jgi:hypothetical protein
MKRIFDKIGYCLLIISFLVIINNYGKYLLYETSFLIFGNSLDLVIINKKVVNNKNIYYFSLTNDIRDIYSSDPTKKELSQFSKIKVRVVPFFKKVYIGPFVWISYIMGLILFLFCFFISMISFWMIFDIENTFTIRIKQAQKFSKL